MKRLLVTVALGAAMVSSVAFAQDEQGGRDRFMRDQTRAEAQQQADSMFQRFDLNHDGVVTLQEAQQVASQFGGGERIQRMINRTFKGAQSLTLQQFEAQALARFDRDDLNHDGTVTAAEREQLRAQRQGKGSALGTAQPATPQ